MALKSIASSLRAFASRPRERWVTIGLTAQLLVGALCLAIWIWLLAYTVLVARDFYRFVDRAVYVSIDDGLANEAYTLASEGRYGFLSSPVLLYMPRHHGEFSYGPWYFYLGAGLIWFFGYSLLLVRSIHLWTIVGTVAAAAFWFRGRAGAVAAGLFGFAILYCFDTTQWPMARPDALGSAFAIALVIAAGRAVTDDRPRYWFVAGLAASCGAFNHLVAWSLVPSSLLLFGLTAVARLRAGNTRDAWRDVRARAAALAAGLLLGATMFYASLDFRFSDQMRMFTAYRELVGSSESPATLILRHFQLAFGYLPAWLQASVWATLAGGWAFLGFAVWRLPAARPMARKFLLPPLIVWSGYLVSLGWYSNFHKGYAILNQVMAFWTAAAIIWWLFHVLDLASARRAVVVSAVMAAVVLGVGVRQVQWQVRAGAEKLRAEQRVPIADYLDRVLGEIPARSTAWGTLMYGIETPRRIQLIQFAEGLQLLSLVPPEQRRALAPEFVIWGYPEVRDNTIIVMRGGEALLNRMMDMLPGVTYRLASMVVGNPYGVTRVYVRASVDSPSADTLPQVSVYNAEDQHWLTNVDRAMAIAFKPIAPAEFAIGFANDVSSAQATRTVAADVPAGEYLLRVSVRPGTGLTKRRMLAAGSPKLLRQTISETGAEGDYSSYFSTETTVMMLSIHEGGPLYVSQFDNGAGADIRSVEVFPIVGLAADLESLPPGHTWGPSAGVRASVAPGGRLQVAGDASQYGYQLVSPAVSTAPHSRVRVVLDLAVEQGKLCSGVLNGKQQWLVTADELRTDFKFSMDETSSFYVVAANCNTERAEKLPSRFTLGGGRYSAEGSGLYTDRLMAAMTRVGGLGADISDLPRVLTAPTDLRVTREVLHAPLNPLQPLDVVFQSPLVSSKAEGWSIAGRAETPYGYLLRLKEQPLDTIHRIFATGFVEKGGVTIGLLRNDQWAARVNVTGPGEFVVVIAPPASGAYSILVANNTPGQDADTSVVFTKLGVVARTGR